MAKVIKSKTLSNRVIHDDVRCNQWYCVKCNYAHNDLIIYEGKSYCPKCFKGDINRLPIYNQNRELIREVL